MYIRILERRFLFLLRITKFKSLDACVFIIIRWVKVYNTVNECYKLIIKCSIKIIKVFNIYFLFKQIIYIFTYVMNFCNMICTMYIMLVTLI